MAKVSEFQETLSMNVSTNGTAFRLDHMDGFSLQASWTESVAALAGTLDLQVSNNAYDSNNEVNPSAQWDDFAGSAVAVSGSGTFIWNVDPAMFKAVRIRWVRTSGQGSVVTNYWAKGVI